MNSRLMLVDQRLQSDSRCPLLILALLTMAGVELCLGPGAAPCPPEEASLNWCEEISLFEDELALASEASEADLDGSMTIVELE